ncbi:MAG TPA: DegT/DnrJ/EryC1/StrS family aminotransferase [Candidatus Desulfovibrio intestinipullorum]|uniref:DegT/DnrJ/EryC1/StrS family aminotransferase n=1 Tax=Candidatus Desulfovibrio intestinipullorum TaxID=2838536 RepID=A0A9D1TQ42_9BACT|nr:DegT/DnrJ/EryC1/StrS family aminotransferase [Candidatus Desulfovibrio intestinipullorum]
MAMRLSRSIVGKAEAEAVSRVIIEDGYLGMGSEVHRFEDDLAAYLGVPAASLATVNTGTAALTLAVDAAAPGRFGQGLRGSVLVPSLTFVASFQAITACGCEPIACEVQPETGTIDLDDAARRLRKDTFAIMPVYYASNPWGIDEVRAFAAEHGLRVIEDAAHAFGCRHKGRKVGSCGDLVCFSFDGIKNITSGEGGLVVAFREEEARIIQDTRLLSVERDTQARFSGGRTWDPDVSRQGWRFHMSNIMAAIGRVQLGRLEGEFIPARKRLAAQYREELAGVEGVAFLRQSPEDDIVPHIQVVRVLNGHMPAVRQYLLDHEIPVGVHYKPNHLLTYYGGGSSACPVTEKLYGELMTLPLHPGLSTEDVSTVCTRLREALKTIG